MGSGGSCSRSGVGDVNAGEASRARVAMGTGTLGGPRPLNIICTGESWSKGREGRGWPTKQATSESLAVRLGAREEANLYMGSAADGHGRWEARRTVNEGTRVSLACTGPDRGWRLGTREAGANAMQHGR